MNRDDFQPKRRIELMYQNSLTNAGKQMFDIIKDMTSTTDILAALRAIMFNQLADGLSKKIVTDLFNSSEKTWRQVARENSNGRLIYEALRKELQGPVGGSFLFQIQRNAEIIKSMPLDISREMTKFISEEAIKGRRSNAILEDLLQMFPDMTRNKARLIARTETSKTSTALTRARAENLGLNWYRWTTSEDSRVRDSHKIMDGVLVNWNDPPSPERLDGLKNPPAPYNAGDIYNCRCFPSPIVNLDYIKWPAKVYRNGSITTMTRAEFEKIA